MPYSDTQHHDDMKEYILKPRSQYIPSTAQRGAHWENYVSKSFDQLKGICHGILADGVVNDSEARYFHQWVVCNADVQKVWPFSEVAARIAKVFEDGVISEEEREEIVEIMKSITGGGFLPHVGVDDTSLRLPLSIPQPDALVYEGSGFCVTGRFAFGTRQKVVDAITERGGTIHTAPQIKTRYLLIGHFCSRDWAYTNYGTKIQRGVELREGGKSEIAIISEETWTRTL